MARFGSLGTQYFDDSGAPLSGGKIYFYEPGTTTDKTTYSDETLSTANTQPLVLDASGRQGNVFFNGQAKAQLYTSADVLVETRDPVGNDSGVGSPFEGWDSSFVYSEGDVSQGSNGLYYISLSDSNQGNDPTSDATNWTRIALIRYWNTNETYTATDYALGSDGMLYKSAQASNQGNNPVGDDGTWWTRHTLDEPTINTPAIDDATFTGFITEEVYTLSGTAFDPSNGTIQSKTYTSNTVHTDSLATGQSILLHLFDGDSYTVTWPTITWVGGVAPILTAADVVVIWKVGSTLYGLYVGSTV